MRSHSVSQVSLVRMFVGTAFLIALSVGGVTLAENGPTHLETDWSHRHLIYSAPKTIFQSVRLAGNVRYAQQWLRRNGERGQDHNRWAGHHGANDMLKGDWSMDMGPGATVGAGMYPAKYSFDVNAAECASDANPDFVVFNTSLAGSSTSTDASQTGRFTGEPTAGQTVTIKNGAATLVLTAGTTNAHTGGNNSGTGTFARSGNTTTQAANLATAIRVNHNGNFVGVTATSTGTTVTVTATTAGSAGNSITLAEGLTGFSWTGTTLAGGTDPQANIIAFDNLYSGCSGFTTGPATFWAYNTGGTVVTSPALSLDGTQVAFIQNVGTTASLVLLKWAASGTAAYNAPVALASQATAAAYRGCTAPCMYTMAFTGTGTVTDSNSAPFYDIDDDVIYVGDDGGHLQKFTGVFSGTPTHVTTGGFPATLTAGNQTTSPVYDSTSGKVFIADGTPAGFGEGYLYSVTASGGTVVKSVELSRGVGFTDGPLVDPVNETVYVFSADNTGVTCPGTVNAITTMPTSFTATTAQNSISISTGTTCSASLSIYDGDFDNAYYSGNAGHLYVCGNIGGAPTLYQVAVTASGVLGAVTAGPTLAASGNICGPVVEMYNPNASGGAKDWIFTSVPNGAVTGAPIDCPAATGCIMSFDVTSGAAISPTGISTVGHVTVAGGASGTSFDNSVGVGTLAGTSQVYFTPLSDQACTTSGGTGGCAIQASQSALN